MKNFTLAFIILFFFGNIKLLRAQKLSEGKGKIYGTILADGRPLQAVTVGLIHLPDSSVVSGAFTDGKGDFSFDSIPFGDYQIKCTYLGYITQVITNLQPRGNKHAINTGDIILSASSHLLQTVQITAHVEKPLIEDDGDKISYNVGESLTSEGDVLLDVLSKVPLVTVDAQGNVQLNGQNPLILINGKPSSLGAEAINNILQSLPADAIEKIEVMENPPAKYQSEGSGGVINIILKKGRNIGISGRASVSAGTRNNYRGNVYASYRNHNTAISGILSSSFRKRLSNGYTDRQTFYTQDTLFTHQEFNNNSNRLSPYARMNIDHDFSEKDNVTFTASLDGDYGSSHSFTTSSNMNNVKEVSSILKRQENDRSHDLDFGMDAEYRHTFDSLGQELSAEISYSPHTTNNPGDFVQSFLDASGNMIEPDSIARINDDNFNHHLGIDIDYNKPLNDAHKSTISFGYRGDFHLHRRNYLTENFDAATQTYFKNDTASNNIQYTDHVQGAYADFSSSINKFRYRLGLRAEQTVTDFNLYDGSGGYQHTYINLFPFVSLNQQLKGNSRLHFSYHIRIDRPGIDQLNPYVYYTDPYNIRYGNPSLKPSVTNEFQIGYSKFLPDDKFGVDARLRYSYRNDITKQITIADSKGIAEETYKNIAAANSYGGHLYISYHPLESLRFSMFAYENNTAYQLKDTFNILLHNSHSFGSHANINVDFSKSLSAELSLDYDKSTTGQGIGYESFRHIVALRYTFPGSKLSLNLRATDPFHQSDNTNQYIGNNFIINTHTNNKSRHFSLTLSYRFSTIGRNNFGKQKSGDNGNDHHWHHDHH